MLAYGKNMLRNHQFSFFCPELIKNCPEKNLPKIKKFLPKFKKLPTESNPPFTRVHFKRQIDQFETLILTV